MLLLLKPKSTILRQGATVVCNWISGREILLAIRSQAAAVMASCLGERTMVDGTFSRHEKI